MVTAVSISKKLTQSVLLSILPPSWYEEPEVSVTPFKATRTIPEALELTEFVVQLATTLKLTSGTNPPLELTIEVPSIAALTLVF